MKKILSNTKTAIVLLVITVLTLGFYTYMLARPISYGMSYTNEIIYDGVAFEGTLKFYPDGTMLNKNSNFEEAFTSYYYFTNGYIFTLMAKTTEEYQVEVDYINENFDDAVASPFYAARINAFKHYYDSIDDAVTTYTCNDAVVFAVAFGAVELVLIALTVLSLVLCKRNKSK